MKSVVLILAVSVWISNCSASEEQTLFDGLYTLDIVVSSCYFTVKQVNITISKKNHPTAHPNQRQ